MYIQIYVSIYGIFSGKTELVWVYRAKISRLQNDTIILVLLTVILHPHTTESVTAINWHR